MPRRDRRFTAEDLGRLYCKHLSLPQKALARAIFEDCHTDATLDDKGVANVISLLAEVLSDFGVPLVPTALELLADAVLSADEARVEEIIEQMGLGGEPSS